LRWYVVINVAAKQLKAMNGGPGGSDMEGIGQLKDKKVIN
jgi:hypothetical protein